MKTKLIQTQDHLLLIDKEGKRKDGFPYLYKDDNEIRFFSKEYNTSALSASYNVPIIAYYPLNSEAEELDLPLLPNPFENGKGLEKSLNKYIKDLHSQEECIGFIEGYKAAQSKTSFTLEDMKKVIEMARKEYLSDGWSDSNMKHYYSEEEIIQSISNQQLPKEFVISDKFSTFEENIKNGKYKW